MNSSFKQRFSSDLYHARLKRGLTQQEVAEQASISARSYRYIESGSASPTVNTFLRLVRLFGLDANGYAETDEAIS